MPQQTFQPLTPEQFKKARAAGFSPEQIVQNEQKRKSTMAPSAAPATTPQALGSNRGFLETAIKRPLERLVLEPARRFGEAVGSLAMAPFLNDQQEARRQEAVSKDASIKVPLFGEFVTRGTGGAKEQAGEALETASYLFPYGKAAGAVTNTLTKLPAPLAKTAGYVASGATGGYAADVGFNLQEGKEAPFTPGIGTAIGTALPLVPPSVRAGMRASGEILGASTGTGYGVIKEAFNAAGEGGARSKAFTEALRGNTSAEQLVDEARDSLSKIVQDRTKAYQESLGKITKDTQTYDISPIQKKLNTMLEDFNVSRRDDGSLDFSRAPGLGRYEGDLAQIQKTLSEWGTRPGDRTIAGIDKLKQTIDDFRRGSADSRKFDAFVTALRNEAKNLGADNPEYMKMLDSFTNSTALIKEIQRGLSLGDKAQTDTAFRKLATTLRTNNEFRKELLEDLDKASGGYLSSKIAGQQLNEMLPRGLARVADPVVGAGIVLTQGFSIPLLLSAALTSPRLVGELVRALGITRKTFNGLLEHIAPGGIKAPGDYFMDSDSMNRAKAYAKANPPSLGLSMKDVNKMSPEERAAANLSAVPKELGGAPTLNESFEGFEDITTKILDDLKGRGTVSKQYLLDALNRGEIRQAEKDVVRKLLDEEGKIINVKQFANKVKAELLPLQVMDREMSGGGGTRNVGRWENISLPDEIKGDVESYGERIYQSPIKTSAGDVHFKGQSGFNSATPNAKGSELDNYFAHTRIEDLPDTTKTEFKPEALDKYRVEITDQLDDTGALEKDYPGRVKIYNKETGEEKTSFPLDPEEYANKEKTKRDYLEHMARREDGFSVAVPGTRRVIEIQSDLFQKGRLEEEATKGTLPYTDVSQIPVEQMRNNGWTDEQIRHALESPKNKAAVIEENKKRLAPLEPYRNTWHERVIREEVKQAAKDGKTKLQFPTGETAMRIEGLAGDVGHVPPHAQIGDTFEYGGERYRIIDEYGADEVAAIPDAAVEKEFNWEVARDEEVTNLISDFQYEAEKGDLSRLQEYLPPRLVEEYDNLFLTKEGRAAGISEAPQWLETHADEIQKAAEKQIDSQYKNAKQMVEYFNDNMGGGYFAQGDTILYTGENGVSEETMMRGTGELDIDKDNEIYKFYEKEIGKFLRNKYNAQRVTDDNNVTWWELDVPGDTATKPVQAFGKAQIGTLVGGAAATGVGAAALAAQPQPLSR